MSEAQPEIRWPHVSACICNGTTRGPHLPKLWRQNNRSFVSCWNCDRRVEADNLLAAIIDWNDKTRREKGFGA